MPLANWKEDVWRVFEDKEVLKLREAITVLGYQLWNQGS
jgi:hypothetical protein